jgi:hypothetical protein
MRPLRLLAALSAASLVLVVIALIARPSLPAQSATSPTISLVEATTKQACGPAGVVGTRLPGQYQITVSGSGLDPSVAAVAIVFDSGGQAPQTYPGPYPVVNGSFSVLLQPGPFYRPFGTYTVTVNPLGNFAVGLPGYPAYFQVPCPTLTIKPPCASIREQITIVGTGFEPDVRPIQLVFIPGAVALPDVPAGSGSFTINVAVPNLPPALYELDANQPSRIPQNSRTARASLQVPCFNPVLKLIPAVGPPGAVTTAVGTGYPPNAAVDFAWTVGVLPPGLATVVTAADGTFMFEILIFPHDTLGARQLVASRNPKSPAFATVMADFLVVPGSVQPNDFSWRH